MVQLSRRLLREMAAGRVLVCDVERPAQSRFRLNPLWLPADAAYWPAILSGPWPEWLPYGDRVRDFAALRDWMSGIERSRGS